MAEEGSKQQKAEEPRTYHRDRLVAESDAFFGHPSHVVVGALAAGRHKTKVNFTRAEVERAIEQFLDHEVESAHPLPETERRVAA